MSFLDSESEVENEDEAAASPPNLGIVAFEKSPSSIAMCYVCNTKIMKGCWRFDYRLIASTKHVKFDFKNVKRVHARCAIGLPMKTRHLDFDAICRFSMEFELPLDASGELDWLQPRMQP